MRISNCTIENFASYKKLTFDFTNQGLTLIHGPNGAGKSTLCDIIPWIVFGKTAKGGAVDEVIAWPGDEATTGTAQVDDILITRVRSPRVKENDLFYQEMDSTTCIRGKDIIDTQRLINARIGTDYNLYLSAAYIHEFSEMASFFISTPKNRRAICEQLVDLSLAKKLQTSLALLKKKEKHSLEIAQNSTAKMETRLEILQVNHTKCAQLLNTFDVDKDQVLAGLLEKFTSYEQNRTRVMQELATKQEAYMTDLAALGTSTLPCPHCGAKKNDTVRAVLAEKLKHLRNEVSKWETNDNPHLAAIEREQNRVNNYAEELQSITEDLALRTRQHAELTAQEATLRQTLGDMSVMEDILTIFRSNLVLNTIKNLENSTNTLLLKHFDAEIQVEFEVTDDVEVSIKKDGNLCSYGQLSKGQRQLLKLCFAVAAMRQAANQQGTTFPQIFIDEALDGLSDSTKIKAFGLLQSLEVDYESIFVVEHSEALKPLFTNQYSVELVNGGSLLEKT